MRSPHPQEFADGDRFICTLCWRSWLLNMGCSSIQKVLELVGILACECLATCQAIAWHVARHVPANMPNNLALPKLVGMLAGICLAGVIDACQPTKFAPWSMTNTKLMFSSSQDRL